MNYSREWQKHLDYYNSLTQRYDWDYVAREQKLSDPKNDKAENLIILNKPVWVEIHDMVGERPFRKIKAISKYNAGICTVGKTDRTKPMPIMASTSELAAFHAAPEAEANQ